MTELELLEVLKIGEKVDVECKEAVSEIPKSLWESYSAMANTNGGIIILGIKEDKKQEKFIVQGVVNPEKRIRDFWNTINGDKVNKSLLRDQDVQILNLEGKDVIIFNIPRANYKNKPIFINNNPYKGTYKRNYEGDYVCTEDEVKAMLRDSLEEGNDSMILENYTIEDIDHETLKKYRHRFSSRQPEHPWNELNNEEFLEMLGGIREDRQRKVKGITVAGILMFGKGKYIRDLFSNINFDYREEIDVTEHDRWSDRVTIDGTWENNLYNFYFMVINKLTSNIKVPFKLENLERKDDTAVHKAIREAFVNQMIHADYNIQGALKIIKRKDYFEFSNPGSLKIDMEDIFKGGNSKSRNPRIQLMFRMIGLGESAGSGFPTILSAWNEQHWRIPELNDITNLNQVVLKLWTVSMIPQECLVELKNIYGNTVTKLDKYEILILVTALLEESVNNARIQLIIDEHPYEITKKLHTLVNRKLLVVEGYGKGKLYYINREYGALKDELNQDLDSEEIEILRYIRQNGSINNTNSRERLGFGKHKSIKLFNSLLKKRKIVKQGGGNKTIYILNED